MIRRAQEGDGTAFEALVQMHDRQVLKLAVQMLNHLEDAQDVYQKIFIKVFCNLPSFRFESEFSTWLYRIVINQCINYRQWRSRRPRSHYAHHQRRQHHDSQIGSIKS
ncbi:MAG: sigma-70 family RNA polymerase sigma factor [candidate division KSB1 bacterium]|nr:sigma-70 family RNA polymerase sigma factor [candidate division KSB1 bacterium]